MRRHDATHGRAEGFAKRMLGPLFSGQPIRPQSNAKHFERFLKDAEVDTVYVDSCKGDNIAAYHYIEDSCLLFTGWASLLPSSARTFGLAETVRWLGKGGSFSIYHFLDSSVIMPESLYPMSVCLVEDEMSVMR